MDDALQALIDFVEGRVPGREFEQKVHSDPALQRLLSDGSLRWHDTYIRTNPYEFLINLDYRDPAALLNAQGAVEFFLRRNEIPFNHAEVYSEFYGLLLGAQPKWLTLDTTFLTQQILPETGNRTGEELKEWLGSRLKELFRYYEKPPQWIQSPAWPINENGPMYFLGQIKIENCELFHDEAAVYVFLDPKPGPPKPLFRCSDVIARYRPGHPAIHWSGQTAAIRRSPTRRGQLSMPNYFVSFRYLIRCGWSASMPSRACRSIS